jgi:chromosome segregation ATPase
MALTCHCTSQGCGEMGGKEVDYRTQKLHAQKDKAHLVEKAAKDAERAVEDQLESIRLHLASTTLLDDVSPSPSTSVPGGRMWVSAPQDSLPDKDDTSTTYSPSRRELISNLLSQLSEIESFVNTLSDALDSELHRSDLSLFVDSSFPLHHLFLEYHNLDADLEKVKSKAASVTSVKASIKGQLDTIHKKLYAAKSTWKENRDKFRLKKAEQNGVKHSTGKDRIYFHYFSFSYVAIS